MGWTKRQFVEQAFEEIGMAAYAYDLQPEQLQSAMRTMDSMMATWNAKGIRVGYPIPTSPENSDLDTETGVPDAVNEAIYLNLAVRLAPRHGKVVLPETKSSARSGYKAALLHTSEIIEMNYLNTTPLGAGNKSYRNNGGNYVIKEEEPLEAGKDGNINFE